MISIANTLHLLSAIIWVGGMFFAYVVLRPVSARQLEPPQRLSLWSHVFSAFFPWVWIAIIILTSSGLWLIFQQFGGMKNVAVQVHIMLTISLVMSFIFAYLFFVPHRQLKQFVAEQSWPEAAKALSKIRTLIAINLALGLSVTVIASAGHLLFS